MSLDPKAHYSPQVVVSALLKRCTRAECEVLKPIAVAEGIMWRCRNKPCDEINFTAMDGASEQCPHCKWSRT